MQDQSAGWTSRKHCPKRLSTLTTLVNNRFVEFSNILTVSPFLTFPPLLALFIYLFFEKPVVILSPFRCAEKFGRTPPPGIRNNQLLCEEHSGFLHRPNAASELWVHAFSTNRYFVSLQLHSWPNLLKIWSFFFVKKSVFRVDRNPRKFGPFSKIHKSGLLIIIFRSLAPQDEKSRVKFFFKYLASRRWRVSRLWSESAWPCWDRILEKVLFKTEKRWLSIYVYRSLRFSRFFTKRGLWWIREDVSRMPRGELSGIPRVIRVPASFAVRVTPLSDHYAKPLSTIWIKIAFRARQPKLFHPLPFHGARSPRTTFFTRHNVKKSFSPHSHVTLVANILREPNTYPLAFFASSFVTKDPAMISKVKKGPRSLESFLFLFFHCYLKKKKNRTNEPEPIRSRECARKVLNDECANSHFFRVPIIWALGKYCTRWIAREGERERGRERVYDARSRFPWFLSWKRTTEHTHTHTVQRKRERAASRWLSMWHWKIQISAAYCAESRLILRH